MTENVKRVVLLAQRAISGHIIIRALRASNIHTYLIYTTRAKSLTWARGCTPLFECGPSFADSGVEVAATINELHRQKKVDCVLASGVEGLLLLDRLRTFIDPPVFPMPTGTTIKQLNDKLWFGNLCEALNIPIPKTMRIAPFTSPVEIADTLGFPVVLKPRKLFGQQDIEYIKNFRQLVATLKTYPHKESIAQEFIPGPDWGMSVFAEDGEITHKAIFQCPDWVTTKCAPHDDFEAMVRNIIQAKRFTGVANFDARCDSRSQEMKLFECNPRFFIRVTACRTLGLDFVRAGLDLPTKSVLTEGAYKGWRSRSLWSEAFADPIPLLMRRLTRVDRRDPAWFPPEAAEVSTAEAAD